MKQKIVYRQAIYTAVLECGHSIGIPEWEFRNAKEFDCYKCDEKKLRQKWQCPVCLHRSHDDSEACEVCGRERP